MDFINEFKKRIKKIDESFDLAYIESIKQIPMVEKRRYNIHKRSIPPKFDGVVVYNIPSKEQAEYMIENAVDNSGRKVFRTRLYNEDDKDNKTYVFYEPVPSDATANERNIYFNSESLMKAEGSDPAPLQLEMGSAILPNDTPWIG